LMWRVVGGFCCGMGIGLGCSQIVFERWKRVEYVGV
jgi:hypothetical protein